MDSRQTKHNTNLEVQRWCLLTQVSTYIFIDTYLGRYLGAQVGKVIGILQVSFPSANEAKLPLE